MSEFDEHIDEIGTMVVDARGRVGQICNVYTRTCRIQYGQSGPHATLLKKGLRVATAEEIKDAGLEGVGRSWPE
jgi:hypothetical protein